MKKNQTASSLHRRRGHKLILTMKLTFIILMGCLMQVSASVYSQSKKFSFNFQNKQVVDVLKEIEENSDYRFFYQREQVDVTRKVDLKVNDRSVDVILDEIFKNQGIRFKVMQDNLIILTPRGNESGYQDMFQQQKSVTGKVTDLSGSSLPGVSVIIKGTTIGTITDIDGKYNLSNIPSNGTLVFSFVGMKRQEVAVNDRSTINVELEDETIGIEEVVAIGYGTMKKSDITGAVSSMKTEELESVPVYNMEQALKTRAAGIQVTQNSGEPGGRIEVRIRGGNSMIGSNQPLYVVDGFAITGGIDFLNPSDIESIDVLKDASATAIYGSRGANGVVIITSKRGKTGQKGKIEVSTFYGVQSATNRYEMLDAKQYAEVANAWLVDNGQEPFFNLNDVQNPGTDWQDQIFRSAPIQNHTITFSGASDATRYSLSGNYYGQEGIIVNSGVKRGSLRLNLDHNVNKWAKIGVNINLSRREKNRINVNNGYYGNNIMSGALAAPPTLPIYDENGQFTKIESIYSFGSVDMRNPLLYAQSKDKYLNNSVLGNTTLEIQLAKGLSFKTLLGLEYETYLREQFSPIIFSNDRGYASEGMSYRNSFLNENTLNYTKDFNGGHSLNLLAGYTYQTNMNRYHTISVSGFTNNTTENYNLGAAETVNPPGSGISEWTLASWLGRANYSLNDKYLFTASLRADGSSRFGSNHKWGYFPSGALAWRVSQEPFLKDIRLISDLKLRTSYGITGNTALNPYQSLDRMSSVKYIYGNQADEIGFVPSGIANQDLKWETTAQFDVGFDLNLIDNRLRFTFDYYQKNTTDLLASVPLPPSVGFGSVLQNIGEIKNTGLEFSVQADLLKGDFGWNVAANVSTNKNEVVELAGGKDIYGSGIGNPFYSSINVARVGEPFGLFYGLVEDGLDDKGDIKYIDQNTDGSINTLDRVIIGNPYPDFIFGFNSDFSYKNFDLSIFFEGVQGNDIFWATAGSHLNSFQRGTNQFADLYGNYWTPENPDPNAKYPRISKSTAVGVSDRFIKDGSYLRLKSLKLAYNIKGKSIGIPGFDGGQIYISGTNLLTITNYPGLDPEVSSHGTDDSNVGVGSRLLVGIDESAYPNAKTYAIGLKLNF